MSTVETSTNEPDPTQGIGSSEPGWITNHEDDKAVPWWVPNIDNMIKKEIRDLLENYSKVPPEDIVKHVYDTREKAWAIRTYPCTGSGLWLQPILPLTPRYEEVLERVKAGASLMDIGCFIGVDLRRLVFDGAPSDKLYGVDIVKHWDVGFDFFRDKDRFSAQYITADVLKADENELASFQGTAKAPHGGLDFVTINHVLHQFNWDTQKAVAVQLARLTRGSGSMILGWQVGTAPGTPHHVPIAPPCFRHNVETMNKMWQEVGELTSTKWSVQADSHAVTATGWQAKDMHYLGEDARLISFVAERLE